MHAGTVMRTAVLALAVVLAAQLGASPAGAQAPACRLSADFEALRAKITAQAGRDIVGACRENEQTAKNGDKIQRTKNGVLHWSAKNKTARFTNHTATWTLDLMGLHVAANGVEGHAAVHDRLGFAPGIEYLFLLKSTGGKLAPKAGADGVFTITLTNPDTDVAWFSDRPQRLTGHRPLATFVDWWDGLGFGAVPPNAVIALPHGKAEQDTLIFTMGRPAWDAKARTLTFQAVRLEDDAPPHRLDAHRARADKTLSASFGAAVVFVDPGDTLGAGNVLTIIEGIELMARCGPDYYNGCDNKDLHGQNLGGNDNQTKVGGGPWKTTLGGLVKEHLGIAVPQFHGANLAGANLSHSGTDDTGPKSAMFNFANLGQANLSYSRWRASQFMNAKASGANFEHSDLTSANFLGADLSYARFAASNLTAAQISTNARNAFFVNSALVSANFNGADVRDADFTGANLAGPAQFVNADARGAKFRHANLDGVNFYGANLVGADFTGANLTRVQFVTANLTNAILDGATVDWANFDRAKMDGMSFKGRIFHCWSSLVWPGVGLTKWGCQ